MSRFGKRLPRRCNSLYNDCIWKTIGATQIWSGGGRNRDGFAHIVSNENLFAAWRAFSKGKRKKPDVIEFSLNLENNIFALQDELRKGRWQCGGYENFSVRDPKPRSIHKATVRDRVLYQAVYHALYPMFDKTFIFDSYSSRKGKGTHAGIRRLERLLRKLSRNYTRPVYALKCDIRKYFDSIDQSVLIGLISEKVQCADTLGLIKRILASFQKTPGKGLPLGNVTSQLFANIYLTPFDWFVKRELGARHYFRYNDDFIIVSLNRSELTRLLPHLERFLQDNLNLELHPYKIIIRSLSQGIDFLGAVLLPHRITIRTKTKRRILKKSQKIIEDVQKGRMTKEDFNQTIASYLGHLSHSRSKTVQQSLLSISRVAS